jgi:hypothetical protein
VSQVVELANGLTTRLVTLYEGGVFRVISFVPESGPGVTRAAEVVRHVTPG